MRALKIFYPSLYYNSVQHIPFKKLYAKGYRGLIFDIDNTLAPYEVANPPVELIEYIKSLRDMGFNVCLVSNNTVGRVDIFNQQLALFAMSKAKKPSRQGIFKAIEIMDTTPSTTIVIGDQIFTDVLAGNRAGIKTILVKPIAKEDDWQFRFKRKFEAGLLKLYLRQMTQMRKERHKKHKYD